MQQERIDPQGHEFDLDESQVGRPQPRSLIVTIYGAYAREAGGWLSVATLIKLMSAVGVEEPAVRSSISRLKRRGILIAETVEGAAGYSLSERARAILAEGDRRIFGRRASSVDDGWLLAVFSVPEAQRAHRHTLRSRLAWLGFGTVSPGVWVAPGHLAEETREVLERLGLAAYVDLFAANYLGFAELPAEIARWWNLDQLHASYADYLATWTPLARRWREAERIDPTDAFTDYVRTLTAWRRLPYLDPGLPAEVLPAEWNGAEAAELFFELRDRLEGPAHDFLNAVRT